MSRDKFRKGLDKCENNWTVILWASGGGGYRVVEVYREHVSWGT